MIVNFSGPKNISDSVTAIWTDLTAKEQSKFTIECDVKKYKAIYVRCGVNDGANLYSTVYSHMPLFTNLIGYTQTITCTARYGSSYVCYSTTAIVYDDHIVFNQGYQNTKYIIRGLYGVR